MTDIPTTSKQKIKVPWNNDAFYGPNPEASQIFSIILLDIVPTPIPLDRRFFVFMQGEVAPHRAQKSGVHVDDAVLANATIKCTMEGNFTNGEVSSETFTAGMHLIFRDWADGGVQDQLLVGNRQDIVADARCTFGETMRSGMYIWKFNARLPDGECLFALELSQWLH
ncbi:hypothetical protein TI39_contig4429g00002 [Zymoseptoria brevis]|uniref:Uncharacterized protein n=1 Tax=Zymoseptoria brevis TaxID=1047168 RepID=A0A0F4G6R1_9PEZI|nr:hypothetical protein TI39_contig4429g00002 [Zymoseptoria brevis]